MKVLPYLLATAALAVTCSDSPRPVKQETYKKDDMTCAVASEMINVATKNPNVFRREPTDNDIIYCHTNELVRKDVRSNAICNAPECYEVDGFRRNGQLKLFSWMYFPDKEVAPEKIEADFGRLVDEVVRPENKVPNDTNVYEFKIMDQ